MKSRGYAAILGAVGLAAIIGLGATLADSDDADNCQAKCAESCAEKTEDSQDREAYTKCMRECLKACKKVLFGG